MSSFKVQRSSSSRLTVLVSAWWSAEHISASANVLRAIRTMRGTQDVSLQTRGRDFYGSLPLGTRAILTVCVGLYVLCVLVGYDAFHEVCMAPHWVLRGGQVHRVFTYAWFHGSVIHLAFNMMAFVPMATSLERLLGTVQFTHVIALFTLLTSCYHVCLAVVAGTLGYPSMHACAIGFSGVIFGVIVVDTHLSAVPHRNVFGFFVVPSQWYPLALLLFLQVLMPQVSFLGHLSGLLAGLTYVRGYLNPLLLRPHTRDAVEASALLGPVARHPAFVAGGAPANAVPGSGGAVLPLFFTGGGGGGGNGGDNGGGVGPGGSGTAAPRQWWQMPTFARRGVGSDEPFAGGGGRATGATAARTATPAAGGADGRTAKEAAAAAAAARAGKTAAKAKATPATRMDQDGAAMESLEVAPSAVTPVAAAAIVESAGGSGGGGGAGVDVVALRSLIDMGFAPDEARSALAAGGGNVAAAVDILSAADDDLR